jgi:branched-subunit amino acid aminotransferase/4-amino-4-deoxychorismate lyase
MPHVVQAGFSSVTMNSSDPFLYHKTTFREVYDREHEKAVEKGWFDVLFVNERGELTEGTISNLFVKDDSGKLLTPSLSCGLLPGTLRQSLIDSGVAQEAVLRPEDLEDSPQVYLGNSVRGLVEVEIVKDSV